MQDNAAGPAAETTALRQPAVVRMRPRHRGQIAIISSLAVLIRRGLAHNKPRLTFPWPLAAGVWLLTTLPPGLTEPLLRLLPKKG